MMKIIWRNPNGNPNGIIPRTAAVVQIRSDEPEDGPEQIIYRRVEASTGPAVEYEVLVNNKKPVHAA
ncbi:MAG: hypothetical protein WBV69_12495 [Candidatus Sulfotelmatobacter sp.]